MIENNSAPVAVTPGATSLPSGIIPPHLMLARESGSNSAPREHTGRAPMKEYMDRVTDKRKWEDVSRLYFYISISIRDHIVS